MVAFQQDGWFSIQNLHAFQTMIKSKTITDHKLLQNVHDESLKNLRQNNQFLYNHLDEPLKESGRPAVSYR
jgi:putative heme degradation protein